MKYLIYARISERGSDFDHSAENSTSMQIEYCKTFIKAKNGIIAGIVKDEFISGGTLKRPAMQKILNDLSAGNADWDCLVTYNLSRLTREPRDLYRIMDILGSSGKRYASASEPEFDATSLTGEMMMGILTHIARYMRKSSAHTVRDRMMSIASHGLWPAGWPPFGYKRGKHKDNKLYVDEHKALIVRDIYEMYASSNHSTREIYSKYKHVLVRSKIMSLLRNPVYLGKIPYGGKIFQGCHDAIISPDLFRQVQDKLPQPKQSLRPKAYRYPFLLPGLVFCHCGCRLTPGTAKSGQYAYYTCTDFECKTRVSAPKLEQFALTHLRECKISKEIVFAAIEEIKKRNKAIYDLNLPELKRYTDLRSELLLEKGRIIDQIISGRFNDFIVEEMNKRVEGIARDLATLNVKIASLEKLSSDYDDEYYGIGLAFIGLLTNLSSLLDKAQDPDKLRAALPAFIKEIRLNKDGTYQIMLNEPVSSTIYPKWCAHGDSNPGPND